MTSVFQKSPASALTTLDIVRDSLDVDGDGNVTFRCRVGRGSGKAVEIPASQFDEFVSLMLQTRDSRLALAQQVRDAGTTATETETTNSSEQDSQPSE